jgi:hypothetical protein
MSLLFRGVLYVVVLFLVTVVYHSQREVDARGTIRASLPPFRRYLGWTLVVVAGMFALEWLFID